MVRLCMCEADMLELSMPAIEIEQERDKKPTPGFGAVVTIVMFQTLELAGYGCEHLLQQPR